MKQKIETERNAHPVERFVGVVAVSSWQGQYDGLAETLYKKKKTALRHHLVPAMAVLLVLISVGSGAFYFVADGSLADISLGTAAIEATDSESEIVHKLKRPVASYKVTVSYPDKTSKEFTLQETGVSVDMGKSAEDAKRRIHASFLQRLQWWKPIQLPLATKTNKAALAEFLRTHTNRVAVQPKDAALAIEGGSVVLTPDITGSGTKLEGAGPSIVRTVAHLSPKPLVLKHKVIPASVKVKDLQPSKEMAENIVKQPVNFTIAGRKITPSTAEVASWVELSPVQTDKIVDVTVNSGKVQAYITNITRNYTRAPRNRTVINTSTGQIVLDGGATGYDVIDKDAAAAAVAKSLSQQSPASAELTVRTIAPKTVAAPAHTKWIIADITNKRMSAYEGERLVKTFLISAGAPATPTVIGQYKITRKYVSQDMYGANADGSRYFQPKVPYVSYFYGGYAIHGNYWRPADWFGRINSSHGCLGVTVADGAWLYDWAPVGTTVITHR